MLRNRKKDFRKALAKKRYVRLWTVGFVIALVILGSIAGGIMLAYGIRHEPTEPTGSLMVPSDTAPVLTVPMIDPTDTPTDPPPATETVPEETPEPPTEPDPVLLLMESMTLREKICQLFIAAPEMLTGSGPVTQPEDTLIDALANYPVGGIIFFQDNLLNDAQCTALLEHFQEYSRIPLLLCVDEEGGLVSRLGANNHISVTHFPPMAQIANPEEAHHVGFTLGQELLSLGFVLDFAPVADLNSNPDNAVIGSRAFGSDPLQAGTLVAACVAGFQDAGLMSCLKHFPGHGDTTEDTHLGATTSQRTLDELRATELIPFQHGMDAGVPVIMVAHISLPNVTGNDTPVTFSSLLLQDILRQELGFQGLIVTDAMNMGAITRQYESGEAAVAAFLAGCDLILMPEDLEAAVTGICDAVEAGIIPMSRVDESVERILKAKDTYGLLLP